MTTSSLLKRASAPVLVTTLVALGVAGVRLGAQSASPASPHDYTKADVTFMQGMIIHHAQAVVMSDWAASHGARADVLTLCKRIALSQHDEITLMQNWLHSRGLSAPDPLHMLGHQQGPVHDSSPMHMPGMDMGNHPMLMKGMLTPAQMRQLDASHGVTFDTLYLTGMTRHHQGALDMVANLFATPGGGQQPEIFTFATDIDAVQRAQMARMQVLLRTFTSGTHAQ